MAETQKLTVKQYADHRGVTRQTVYKYVNRGQLTKSLVTVDGKIEIDPVMADRELSQNLDQIFNPKRSRTPKKDQASRLEIQEKAVTIACEGEDETGILTPWPLWAAKHIKALADLDPDRVTIERFNKTEWRLTVDDINTETGEPAPWAVTMEFDFNPDQEG
jgi:hypothetical protein